MSDDVNAKSPSGLHANAAPFVPVTAAKSDKANVGKQAAAGDAASSNSSSTAAAVNGAASGAANAAQQGDKGSTSSSTNQTPVAASTGRNGATGGKGQKGANNIKLQPSSSSKLVAAASAAPFVPTKPGSTATVQAVGASDESKQQQQQVGKQAGNRKQHHQRQQQIRQQQQQQQQQLQQKQPQQQLQQKEEPKDQQQQQPKDQKDPKPVASGKMSAAAATFVPKTASDVPASATAASGGATNSQQQQQRGQVQSIPSAAASARLKSPLKGSTAGSSSSGPAGSMGTPIAAHASPARPTPTSSSRGGRGGRSDSSGRTSNLGLGSTAGVSVMGLSASGPGGAYGGGSLGAGRGLPGGAAAVGALSPGPGGPKRALLAQFQGNYQYGAGLGACGPYGGYSQHHHHGSAPGKQLLSGQFMTEGLRQQLQQANYLTQLQYTPSGDEQALPDKIGHYHTLYPLEDLAVADGAGVSSPWGVSTSVLKGISAKDGRPYALRVVCGKQVIPSLEMLSVVRSAVDMWSCLTGHPGLLVPLEGLVASELDGSPSLVVVYSYVPGAVTLAQAHLQPTQTAGGQLVRNTPSEELLWSYTVQLAGILRAVHATGLALRPATLSASKVLLTPVGRLKVCGMGVAEALTGEVVPANQEDLLQLQRDDVVAMGELLLQLACAVGSLASPSLDFASVHYSPEFVRLLVLLLGVADGGGFSWRAVNALLGERLLLEMDSLAIFNEQLLEDLSKEMENGRLFRLVSKLSYVTDRATEAPAGHTATTAYTDSGDRYLLSLFRDFVFHQGELDNGRVLDWGHAVECLNKLDAGVSEQVLLQSRDERSLLVVSYADIKRAVETSIAELRTRDRNPPAGMIRGHGSGVGHMFGLAGR